MSKFTSPMLYAHRQGYSTCGLPYGGIGQIHYAVDGSKVIATGKLSEIKEAFGDNKTIQETDGFFAFICFLF